MAAPSSYRVLELYSGVGGMHYALQESNVPYTVVAAVDINTTANQIYHHNFKDTKLISCGIEKLTEQMKKWQVDMIVMSPPCQPFTRVGKKKDVNDIRAKSFLHVLHVIKMLDVKPSYILVENVKGFEKSQARLSLVHTLQSCSYVFQEFLLTPLQFGIPNSRLRYYLVAKRSPLEFSFPLSQEIQTDLPPCATKWMVHKDRGNTCCHGNLSSNARTCQIQDGALSKEMNICRICSQSLTDSRQPDSACQNSHVEISTSFQTTDQSAGCSKHNIIHSNTYYSEISIDTCEKPGEDSCSTNNIPIRKGKSDLKSDDCVQNQVTQKSDDCHQNQVTQKSDDVSVCTENLSTQNLNCFVSCEGNSLTSLVNTNKTKISDVAQKLPVQYLDCRDSENIECANNSRSCFTNSSQVVEDYENCGENLRLCGEGDYQEFVGCQRLERFMETMPPEYFNNFLLADKDLKMFIIMDIVHPGLRKSSCFTRRYGHYVDGAGPIIQMSTDVQAIKCASEFKSRAVDLQNRHSWGEAELKIIRDLQLRYFTPREISNILCFPHHFAFPEVLSTIQLYRCLGNSLNVHVVSVLIRLMIDDDQ